MAMCVPMFHHGGEQEGLDYAAGGLVGSWAAACGCNPSFLLFLINFLLSLSLISSPFYFIFYLQHFYSIVGFEYTALQP